MSVSDLSNHPDFDLGKGLVLRPITEDEANQIVEKNNHSRLDFYQKDRLAIVGGASKTEKFMNELAAQSKGFRDIEQNINNLTIESSGKKISPVEYVHLLDLDDSSNILTRTLLKRTPPKRHAALREYVGNVHELVQQQKDQEI